MRTSVNGGVVAGGLLVLGATLLVGCSSGAPSPAGLTASASQTPAATATPDAAAVDEAQVRDVYARFWVALVAAERGDPDPTLFAGVATGEIVEAEMLSARNYQEWGIVREGEPVISDVTVRIDGDTALVAACVDQSQWVVPDAGEDEAPDVVSPEVEVTRVDGQWLVTRYVEPSIGLTC